MTTVTAAADGVEYTTRPYTSETYGTPVLAVPICTVYRNGRWQHENLPRLGFISGIDLFDTGSITVQFEVRGNHHVRRAAEVMVIDENLAQEDLDTALAVAEANAADLKRRSGLVTITDNVRRRLRSEADEAEAAAVYWKQEGGR